MNCEEIKKLLSAYIDDELSAEEAEVVRRHLEECPTCSREYDCSLAAWDALLADRDVEPQPDYTERFWRKARADARPQRPWPPMWLRVLRWSPAVAAGFVAAFIAGRLTAYQPETEPAASSADVAFLQNYEMIEQMDLLQDFPLLNVADLSEENGGAE